MLRHAFKEWAVLCKALAEGRQTLILRKGGILEIGAGFQVEHSRFWLFPTYVHQQAAGIKPEAGPLLDQVQAERPDSSVVRLSSFAEAVEVFQVRELERALSLSSHHVWSEETVRSRFHYRRPGLFVLVVRVDTIPQPIDLPNTPYYEGCRSWVELDRELPTDGARPAMEEDRFRSEWEAIRRLLSA